MKHVLRPHIDSNRQYLWIKIFQAAADCSSVTGDFLGSLDEFAVDEPRPRRIRFSAT
ncbi:hypothetical protein J5X84_41680 [Streptosporangiaceae bacterium NEAU-GS5]|nr:hypothetical protein [Streptosporangiaceae bacterium NEAU-GS5]